MPGGDLALLRSCLAREPSLLACKSEWPLSIMISQQAMAQYQLIFRHLFELKCVQRQLNGVWQVLQAIWGLFRWGTWASPLSPYHAASPVIAETAAGTLTKLTAALHIQPDDLGYSMLHMDAVPKDVVTINAESCCAEIFSHVATIGQDCKKAQPDVEEAPR
ncbi:hypothetical protein ABBQ32_000669 [Trebouxia sp. C0010 RCD-2024]